MVVAFVRLWWWVTGPVPNDIPDPATFTRMLRILMYRGVHRPLLQATLTIYLRNEPERRLVFTKVIDQKGLPGFSAVLPRDAWMGASFDTIRSELDRRGIRYAENAPPDAAVLTCDLGQDVGGAYVIAQVLFGALGAHLHRDCLGILRHAVFENTPRLTGVDHPDQVWF